jgi:hypothetical protein
MPGATESSETPVSSRAASPGYGRLLGHAVGLTALAVATPLCDLARRFPEFLWSHGLAFNGVAALAACLIVLPALPLALLVVAARGAGAWKRGGLARVLGGIAIGLPAVLLALQAAVRTGLGGWSALAGAVMLGALAGAAYWHWRSARAVATLLSLVSLVAPVQLLLAVPVGGSRLGAGELPAVGAVTSAPVVFVIFDELPMVTLLADGERWDSRNFPNFERLASTSHAFLNAHSVSPATLVAVPAIISGSRLPTSRAPTLANFPRNLFTLFAGNHEIHALEPATELCPEDLNRLITAAPARGEGARRLASDLWILLQTVSLPRPWADDLPAVDVAWRDFAGAGEITSVAAGGERDLEARYQDLRAAGQEVGASRGAEFRRFVASIDDLGEPPATPALHFIHTMLPHGPWLFDAAGRAYVKADRSRVAGRSKVWSREAPEMVGLGYQRHLLQARYADRLLGELLDRLEATGRLEPSLVVVTADHGASFRPGNSKREEAHPEESLWVPLLIKAPGQTTGVAHRAPLTTLDILPTVLDVLGAQSPWPFEGATALASSATDGELPDASEAQSWKISIFGEELDFEPPLRTNRHAGLIGLETSAVPTATVRNVQLVKLEPARVLDYDPAASYAPLLISGALKGGRGRADCCDLAFAVNGRIAAVQRTYAGARRTYRRFQVLLPRSALAPGANDLSIHVVVESRRGVRLASLTPGV